MELQETQIAMLRERIARLEGSEDTPGPVRAGGSSVDDFSIKVGALQASIVVPRIS
jgi:hypothetical protein